MGFLFLGRDNEESRSAHDPQKQKVSLKPLPSPNIDIRTFSLRFTYHPSALLRHKEKKTMKIKILNLLTIILAVFSMWILPLANAQSPGIDSKRLDQLKKQLRNHDNETLQDRR